METLADLLAHRIPSSGKPVLLFDDLTYTYAGFEVHSNRVAHALIGLGVKSGDIVCQVIGSRPELIINLFGIIKCGAVYAPLNPSLTKEELGAQLADCKASVVISEDDLAEEKAKFAAGVVPKCRVISITELGAHSENMPCEPPNRLLDPDGMAVLCYTSGTSSRPKGVQLSHRNILTYAQQVIDRTGVQLADRLLVIMPIFHAYGLSNQAHPPHISRHRRRSQTPQEHCPPPCLLCGPYAPQ
jgi:acyl-CoA synthetase (AMP-forming)/AMP-acid ligase II